MSRSRIIAVVSSIAIGVGLPMFGWWLRHGGPPRCDYDGQRVEPMYRVRILDGAGHANDFCCVRCATHWLDRGGSAAEVRVVDEMSGEEINAREAYFVESAIVTNRVTGNHVHAFRTRSAADEHARAYGGLLLEGSERPLRVEKPK